MNLPDPKESGEMTGPHYAAQKKFVTSFISDFSEVKAARAAGYTGKYPGKKGAAMLNWPGTRHLIQEQMASLSNTGKITREWILNELLARYEDSIYSETPKYLESAKILDMIKKNAGLEDIAEDNELKVTIKRFLVRKDPPEKQSSKEEPNSEEAAE